MRRLAPVFGLLLALIGGPAFAQTPIEAPGPHGPLAGTLLGEGPGKGVGRPVVLIVPGSGPTDRDGNNPMGVTAAPYRLLAEALAREGIATVRIDKRGMFGSKAALPDANAVTIADYAADVHAWAKVVRARTGAPCVWVLGHSEGGLVALAAAQTPADLCGVLLVATPGRPLAAVIRDQLATNPANAPILPQFDAVIASYTGGKLVDPASVAPGLAQLFPPALTGYWRSILSYDPARLIAAYAGPVLIEQGSRDLQVSVADAKALAMAQPRARLAIVDGANHVLKYVVGDVVANYATYGDPSLPLADGVVAPIVTMVKPR